MRTAICLVATAIGIFPVKASAQTAPGVASTVAPTQTRVPLVIESVAGEQEIADFRGLVETQDGRYRQLTPAGHALCRTPCTLLLRPAEFTFISRGPVVRSIVNSLRVPETGLRIRLRAPSSEGWAGGNVAMALSFAFNLVGALLLVPGTSAGGGFVFGAAVSLTLGTAAGAGGIALLVSNRGGVASSERPSGVLPAPAIIVGPLADGVVIGGAWRF